MSTPRHPLPTDLVALVSHDGRVYPNEAKTWDRLGREGGGPHPLGSALEQWFSFATGKHTWVSVSGATIRGLISARPRAKRTAWEVDCLIDADKNKEVALSLLKRMSGDITKQGAERVFLRLAADSCLVEVARQAGFFPYAQETLYRCDAPPRLKPPPLPLRPRAKGDAFGLFQLYRTVAPASVRAIEGATHREWQAAQEPWGGRPVSLVLEDDGIIVAWLRILPGDEARFSLLIHPDRRDADILLQSAVARLTSSRIIFCLASGEALTRRLRRLGFSPIGQYVHFARRLVQPVQELVPEKLGTAVPAS